MSPANAKHVYVEDTLHLPVYRSTTSCSSGTHIIKAMHCDQKADRACLQLVLQQALPVKPEARTFRMTTITTTLQPREILDTVVTTPTVINDAQWATFSDHTSNLDRHFINVSVSSSTRTHRNISKTSSIELRSCHCFITLALAVMSSLPDQGQG